MQYRVYNRKTLRYVDGGYVKSWSLDDDYLTDKNSTLSVVTNVNDTLKDVAIGDIIAVIKDHGAAHKGVITAVDTTAFEISYKGEKELFNDNVLNPLLETFSEDDKTVKRPFGIDVVVWLLKHYFSESSDELKNLPIRFLSVGDVLNEEGSPKMLWNWTDDVINVADWLTELFEKYKVSLSWTIDFDIVVDKIEDRSEKYVVTLSALTKENGIIKDNVTMQTIAYTMQELPDATVCYVIDSSTKKLLGTYYLYEKDGEYSVSTESAEILPDGRARTLPIKTVVATLSKSSNGSDSPTAEDVAADKLIPSQFNQAIEIRIAEDSRMFDFENAKFGDQYQIINEHGSINSIFTGKKKSWDEKWVTLYFGLGRQKYTDIKQIQQRKQRYKEGYK